MTNPPSFLHIQNPSNESVEVPPQTDGMPLPNVHHADPYYLSVNYNHGHWTQDSNNMPYQGPTLRPTAANLGGSYTYYRNPNVDYPASRNNQDNLVASSSSHMEYPSPPTHDIPDGGVGDRAPLMLGATNSLSQSVPDPPPSETSAMENLKCLADRYLHDPGSRIDTLRMGLSPSGSRLRVTVVIDIDV